MSAPRRALDVAPLVTRRRRGFGLDGARRPDPVRIEAAVLDWLARALPEVVPLRLQGSEQAPTLVLLLPGGRPAVVRIDPEPRRPDAEVARLAETCRRCRVPLLRLSRAGDARAALRRLGLEPDAEGEG